MITTVTTITCDRCHKIVEPTDKIDIAQIASNTDAKYFQLCSDCWNSFGLNATGGNS